MFTGGGVFFVESVLCAKAVTKHKNAILVAESFCNIAVVLSVKKGYSNELVPEVLLLLYLFIKV